MLPYLLIVNKEDTVRCIEQISNSTETMFRRIEVVRHHLEAILRHLEAISDPRKLLLTDGTKLLTAEENLRINE